MKKVFLVLVVLAAVVAGVTLLVRQAPQSTAPAQEAPISSEPEPASPGTPPSSEGASKEVTVASNEFSFSPKDITVKRGQRVKLTFRNVGAAPHNWTLEGLGVATRTIGGGQSDIVEFTAPQTLGIVNVTAFCSVPGHREAGMVGKLIIQ